MDGAAASASVRQLMPPATHVCAPAVFYVKPRDHLDVAADDPHGNRPHGDIQQSAHFRDSAAKPEQPAAILRAAGMIFGQRRKPARGGGVARFAEFWPDFQRAAPGFRHAGSSGVVRGHRMVHHPSGAHPVGDGRPHLPGRREIPTSGHHPLEDVPLLPYRVELRGVGGGPAEWKWRAEMGRWRCNRSTPSPNAGDQE